MTTEIHPKYRPDIDGLRAVAILSVLIFHVFPLALTGGFVGVDIFFVISGYLISTILFREIDAGTFRFSNFYSRRVKRIYPAFLLVLASCLIVGWLFLLPDEWHQLGKHAFNACLFILNINLFQENGYFEIASELKPLLHLWSLCVEEQYYLIWPVILYFFWKYKKYHLALIGSIMVMSFIANIFLTYKHPEIAFYFSAPRFWELLSGSLLAFLHIYKTRSARLFMPFTKYFSDKAVQNIFSSIGILLLAIAIETLNEKKSFPGFWALLPICGAVLLIATPQAWLNKKILGHRLPVAIGLISYPLYLWHWPILVFTKIITGELQLATSTGMIVILASFILAIATYLLLEKPLRKWKPEKRKTVTLLVLWIALALLALLPYKNILPSRMSHDPRAMLAAEAVNDWTYPGGFNFRKDRDFQTLKINPGRKNAVLFIGDSHLEQYWPRIEQTVLQQPDKMPTVIFATSGGCLPIRDTDRQDIGYNCKPFNDYAYELAQSPEIKTIVLSGYWETYFGTSYQIKDAAILVDTKQASRPAADFHSPTADLIFKRFESDLEMLHKNGKKVYLLLSNPAAPFCHPNNVLARLRQHQGFISIDKNDYLQATNPLRQKLIAIAQQSGAIIIDPVPSLCGDTSCPVVSEDGKPFYKDMDHLRPFYVKEKAGYLDKTLR